VGFAIPVVALVGLYVVTFQYFKKFISGCGIVQNMTFKTEDLTWLTIWNHRNLLKNDIKLIKETNDQNYELSVMFLFMVSFLYQFN
jgi:hypothetical protein